MIDERRAETEIWALFKNSLVCTQMVTSDWANPVSMHKV